MALIDGIMELQKYDFTDTSFNLLMHPAEQDKVTLFGISMQGSRGWVIGQKGTYLTTADSGRTWALHSDRSKTRFWLRAVDFCDAQTGVMVGSTGTVLFSTDGGETLRMLSGIPAPE